MNDNWDIVLANIIKKQKTLLLLSGYWQYPYDTYKRVMHYADNQISKVDNQ